MRVVVLAAGQGTRLRPLTDDRPKCMVSLGGTPLLHRQLAAIRAAGVRCDEPATVVAGYRADQVRAPSIEVVPNPRFAETNMVASLLCAREVLESGEDVLVSYGDIVCEPRVVAAVAAAPGPIAVAVDLGWRTYWELRFADPLDDAETLRLRDDGTIAEIGRRPGSLDEIEAQYLGLIKLTPEGARAVVETHDALRAADPAAVDTMYLTDLLQALIDGGVAVRAAPVRHGWLEIDSVADVELFASGATAGLYDPRELALDAHRRDA